MDQGTASCQNTCTNQCNQAGDTQCNGDTVQTCQTGTSGCLEWIDTTNCTTTNQLCIVNEGIAQCENPPTGDDCGSAIPISSTPFTIDGTDITADATDDYDFSSNTDCGTAHGVDIFFTIDLNAGDTLHMAETGGMDAVIRVLDTCDATSACLFSADYGENDLSFVAPADGTYFIVLEAYYASPSSVDYHFVVDVYPAESACGDGIDNDHDGDTDCEDSDCAGQGSCETTETTCNDSFDNDGDGDTDCEDTDCFGQTGCTTETICGDGEDNDNDGDTDCADSDCQTTVACQPLKGIWQEFGNDDPVDIVGKTITFTPDATDVNGYTWAVTGDATTYPIVPGSGTTSATMDLGDDDSQAYALTTMTGGFPFYGTTYSQIYVGSNGYIALGEADTSVTYDATDFLASGPKIAGFSDDLAPDDGGTITIDEFAHSVVVTYDQVPEYWSGDLESFQIELLDDGVIKVHYLQSQLTDEGIVGITAGVGIAPYPAETDFVLPPPPVINEVLYDDDSGDDMEFVEIKAPSGTDLSAYTLVHYNGNGGSVIWSIPLTGYAANTNGLFLIGSSHWPNADIHWADVSISDTNALQNGADSLVLYKDYGLGTEAEVDAVEWETGASVSHAEGSPAAGTPFGSWNTSFGRYPDGTDTDDNSADFFTEWWPTPGEPNNGPSPDDTYNRITGSTQSDYADSFPIAIPDNDATGITVTFDTSTWDWVPATVGDIEVGINISHSYIGDLEVTLTAPDGTTTVVLHDETGGGDDDINGVYDLTLTPDDGTNNMDSFNGLNAQGTWTLHISDNGFGDMGQLNEWILWIK